MMDSFLGKGRKRTKFARSSGAWRLAEDSSDSQEEVQEVAEHMNGQDDSIVILDVEAPTSPVSSEPVTPTKHSTASAIRRENQTVQMPPPPFLTPRRPIIDTSQVGLVADHRSDTETTPRLLPLASPGLPMVSPLVKRSGASVGFFEQTDGSTSELDASAEIEHDGHQVRPRRDPQPEYISLITPDEETFNNDVMSQFAQHHQDLNQGITTNEDEVAIDATGSHENFLIDSSDRQRDPMQFQNYAGRDSGHVDLLQDHQVVAAEDEDMYGSSSLIPEVAAPQPCDDRQPQEIPEATARSQDVTREGDPEMTHINEVDITSFSGSDMVVIEEDKSSEILIDVSRDTQNLSPPSMETLDGAHDLDTHVPEAGHDLLGHGDRSSETQLLTSARIDDPVVDLEAQLIGSPDEASIPQAESTEQPTSPQHITMEEQDRNQSVTLPLSPVATQDEPQSPDQGAEATVAIRLPPTPDHTQEQDRSRNTAAIASSSQEPPHLHEEVVTQNQPLQLETPASKKPTRSRKSLSLHHISQNSSPYFTPRRSARMHSSPQPSSPKRKENLPPVSSPQRPLPSTKSVSPLPAQINGHLKEKTKRLSGFAETYGLTTASSYYPPLATVDEFFAATIDVLAICTTDVKEPQRAKTGPKDYHCTYQIVDPSLASREVVVAQVFRPYKTALPRVSRGSVVLLRNMKVQSQKRKCMLLSTESSSWAVFTHPEHSYTKASMLGITIAGPPIEYGPSERLGAIDLMQWWDGEGAMKHAELKDLNPRATNGTSPIESRESLDMSPATSTAKVPPTPLRRSRRRGNRTDNDGNADDSDPDMAKVHARRNSDISLASQRPNVEDDDRSQSAPSVIHELRDGTKYVDESPGERKRRGTRGQSLIHELRDGTSYIDE